MKIAVIGSKGLPPKQGGIEHHCAEVYPRLVKEGCSVDLFARSSYTQLSWRDRFNFSGVQVISLPGTGMRGVDALLCSALGSAISSLQPYDIIHFHALGPALWTVLPRLSKTAKVLVTCHGLDWQREKWGKSSSRLICLGEKNAVRFADKIIVVSQDLQNYFFKTYNRETIYISNAPASYIDCDNNFSYGKSLGLEPQKYLLFLGRLVPEKRPDLLIQAFKSAQLPLGWKLVLAGGVSDTSAYSRPLLALANNRPDIVFAGELRGKRLTEIVRNAGLFTLPSDLEGLPLALLEAMQEGIPVITSDIPVHRQLVGFDRGILFQAGSIESYVSRINWAVQHLSLMSKMSVKAKRYIEVNHSWDRISTEYLDVYQSLIDTLLTRTSSSEASATPY